MHEDLTEATRKLKLEAMDSLTNFLCGYPWDAFVTQTFKHRVMFQRQALKRVSDRMTSIVWPVRRAFLATEEHYLGGYHVHGLLEFEHRDAGDARTVSLATYNIRVGLESVETPMLVNIARERLARLGWCRVEEVKLIGGVAGYCAKYLTKEVSDYDFYGKWDLSESALFYLWPRTPG
jgi:hypothetical protein